jgi:hypothetical protein
MAAAATAGAAIGVAGGAIAAGATNIGGGIQAIMAASNKAAEFAGSGGGSDSALRMTADYLQGGQSNSDSASSKTTTPLGEAMGGSSTSSRDSDSKYGPSMIKNLATGIGEVAKQKIKDRTSNTFGGQVASAISNSGQPTPSFGGDSLSGSDETVDPAEEVAAFTNGNNSGNAQSA